MEGSTFWYSYILSIVITTFLLASSANAVVVHSIISDEEALRALKDRITFDPNQILAKNWSAGSPICGWTGVTCGKRHFRVTALDISNMGLTGTIVPHLGNLSFLVSLNLSYNNFHGDIPHELGHLRRLKWLNMTANELTGEIPSSVGSLNQLEDLHLNNNTFTGSIPSSISNLTRLKDLHLSYNTFTGAIPYEIYNISSLEILYLSHNQLSGSLPASICGHFKELKMIELAYNMLSGPVPSQLSQCSKLRSLGVSYNNFSGPIPKEIGNMRMLEQVFFTNNRLQGKIPNEISNLTSLRILNLGGNNITGTIPKEIGILTSLQRLYLGVNSLAGTIPKEIGNITNLEFLYVDENYLTGTIPEELGNLRLLEYLLLADNRLYGSVPAGIFNISTLMGIVLNNNFLSGSIPSSTGFRLPNLENLSIVNNNFSGVLPPSISNATSLIYIEIFNNNFGGTIPQSLGNLRFLQVLRLSGNKFTRDPSSLELEFLTPLANCNDLRELHFGSNPLNGILPESIGNLSKSIEMFIAYGSGISGGIPVVIGNLSSLVTLALSDNQMTGLLPTSIASLKNLQYFSVELNQLSGSLSCNLFGLQRLNELRLSNNMFSGGIPECIGNCSSLRILGLQGNKLRSNIPMNLWSLENILMIYLSNNFLNGSLPSQVGNLKVLTLMDLSMNNLSGDIPNAIGNLQNLVNLSISHNLFEGSIPDSIGRLISLEFLDLSKNNLSGSIPTLEKLQYLTSFNISYNNLAGLIPSGGPFVNFTWESFIFNKALCGEKKFHVPPCPAVSPKKSWLKGPKHMLVLCFGLVAFLAAITLVVVYLILARKNKLQKPEGLRLLTTKDRISFYELQQATNKYNERNLLGQGSFGSVYKGTLRDGRVVAVKVFNLQAEGAFKSFDIECEVLRNLRHRNLTHVISSCSNLDFKAIVFEFMPNGSLENWLHSSNHFLSITERLNIMIDVAYALHYLHAGYPSPVVHADLKPSNVLLDESKIAHVSDFGIAKMLEECSITYTNTLATFGYIAPEYGSEGLVSTMCDVYSFGIMLMEVFTTKRPSDEMFNEGLTLRDWVSNSLETGVAEIIDDGLLNTTKEERFALVMDCVILIMNVALNCTKMFPRERSDIGEVLATLQKIKLKL